MAGRSLAANIASSSANVVVVIGVSLLAVPVLVDRLGLAGYGLWTLAQSIVIYVSTAEAGFGPALARFTSVRKGQSHGGRDVLVLALGLYTLIGLLLVVVLNLLAVPLVDAFGVPRRFHDDVVETVRVMGWVSLLALLASATGHVLNGYERFTAGTVSNVAGSVAFLVSVLVLLRDDPAIHNVAIATAIQWGLVALLRLAVLRAVLFQGGRWLPERTVVRDLFGFSARLQIASLATLLNSQTDRVVVGAIASPRTLGQVGLGAQFAEAGRFLGYAAFTPLASRMAVTFGARGRDALDAMARRYRWAWTTALCGGIAVAAAAARPAITSWVGPGHDRAAWFGVLLVVAYSLSLLPSPAFGYLRATGQTAFEGRFGVVTVALNLVLTLALGIPAGATGVVLATTLAYVGSSAWAMRRSRQILPARDADPPHGAAFVVLTAAIAAATTYLAGEALVDVAPRIIALIGTGLVATGALGAYLRISGVLGAFRAPAVHV